MITSKQFAEIYARVDVPIVPEDWREALYTKLRNDGMRGNRAVDKDRVLPTQATSEDVARAIKLLASQDWYVQAIKDYLIDTDDTDEFMGWPNGRARDLLYWFALETGLSGVSPEGYLTHSTGELYNSTAYGGVIDMVARGATVEEVFEDRLKLRFELYNII